MRYSSLLLLCLFNSFIPLTVAISDDHVPEDIAFQDVTDQCGVQFQHYDGSDGRHFIIESMSAGLALFDYDNDGDLDVYLLNGSAIDEKTKPPQPEPINRLFRNDGNWEFVDVTADSNTGDASFGLGVGVADFDNDGDTDLYINNYGPNALLQNNGDGTFENISIVAGVDGGERVSTGVAFFDMDDDGDLDLYSANYIEFSPEDHRVHLHKGLPSYPSVGAFRPDADTLYENMGDGTFRDASETTGVAAYRGRSMGVAIIDFDLDGDSDVFVANDTQENFLFENLGDGTFDEMAVLAGVSHDFRGRAQASMGVEVLDYNADSKPDLAVTSFTGEFVTLYRNDDGIFTDVSAASGLGPPTLAHVTWGLSSDDFDGDGREDLWIGTGGLDDQHDSRGGTSKTTGFAVEDIFLRGENSAYRHTPSATKAIPATSTRGLVSGDLDGDANPDVVLISARGKTRVLKNCSPVRREMVTVELVEREKNRDCLGASIRILHNGNVRNLYTRSGRSYQSDSTYQRKTLKVPKGSRVQIQRTATEKPRNFVAERDAILDLSADEAPQFVTSQWTGIEQGKLGSL